MSEVIEQLNEKTQCVAVVLVHSCQQSARVRDLSRLGWVNELRECDGVVTLFVVGGAEEAKVEGDTLYLPCDDSYPGLPFKTIAAMRYVSEHYDFEAFFKCDDDAFVIPDRLLARLAEGGDYVGYKSGYVAAGGCGYMLSRRAFDKALTTYEAKLGPEDKYLAVALRGSYAVENDSRFEQSFIEQLLPRPDNRQIAIHYVNNRERLEKALRAWHGKTYRMPEGE